MNSLRETVVAATLITTSLLGSGCGQDNVPSPGTTLYTSDSISMEPLFEEGEDFRARPVDDYTPRRGDVVVFHADQWLPEADALLVKRVIAIGGDEISCAEGASALILNGQALDESSYRAKDTLCAIVPFAVTIPDGKLWVLGDNRENSLDSAAQSVEPNRGFVDQTLVVAVYEPDVED